MSLPAIKGVHHVALTVTDVGKSAAWYTELFGLVKMQEATEEGHEMVLFMHPGSQLFLGLHQWTGSDGGTFSERRTGLDHIGFHVERRADLEQWQARLQDLGVTHTPIADVAYGHVLAFRDPDGIQLEFFATPSSFWSHPTPN